MIMRMIRLEIWNPCRLEEENWSAPRFEAGTVLRTFWSMEDDYTVEPYIRVAAGDYLDLCEKWGKDSALTAILLTIGHELTHYFQWINALELTLMGMERQATKYARYVLDDYAETREHP